MFTVHVNGKDYQAEQDKKLMRFLRDDLRLTSVKDGCSQGACGTCTVLVDGKTTRACIPMISKMEGKSIVTVEGLSEREKEVYAYAFATAGAVQCGFCIPGMVMSAKGLIDVNPDPTRLEVIAAIRNNICRCTGYKKIIDGILLSARIFRENLPVADNSGIALVGDAIQRIDAREKVLGTGEYPDDIYLDGMIYGSAVRSEYPRAKVLAIHAEEAQALEGVIGVYTAEDIPGQVKVGHLKQDWDTMIPVGKTTHYLGDAICLVAAETPEILERAKSLVKVDYEVLEPVLSPFDAMKEDAPLVHASGNILAHEHLVRGNADEVIANSKYKVTKHYETPWTEHAFLEPECAVAMPFDDGVFIYSTDQGTYDTRHECCIMLGLPPEKVIVENKLVGGGFGGKEDVSVQHHAALLAYLTKRIVKVKLSRQESIVIHPKRHPMWMDITTACDENGILTAMKAVVVSDTGAYASLGGPVLQRACTHAAGPYNFQVIDIDGKAVYTNNPPAGAYRGFGVTQTCFGSERNLDLLAEMAGISPWEIRYRNAIRPGQVLPNGQIADDSTGVAETLEAVKDIYESEPYAGIACAMKNAGVGVGLPDWGRCRLLVKDGKIQIHAGASCIGQGLGTVLTQVVSETTGLPVNCIKYCPPNTADSPDSGTTSGSRQTLITGEAAKRASEDLREELAGQTLAALEGKEYYGEYLAKTDRMGSDVPNPVSHVAYGYATQVCVLNEDGTVKKMVAAHDVGKAVNPVSVEGQIEGGVVMGMGYALTERYEIKEGYPVSRFGTLGLFKADKVPELVSLIVEKPGVDVGYGAIGIGEITSIPTAPAVAGAYYKWNGEFQTVLPLEGTPYTKKK
ncbi:selenium-dependent xanthine dehydrogenase [Eubacterium sp. am_0171]|uniref:Aldehyde oxidoreductase n=1 Tax=Faecalicatena contorta TaxID=39482 RepID=A0A174D5G6_9FIRM|nr:MULTISPECIES: selenium-dependent xanthine dehydrogenase [Clostridia]MSC84756.1 selenium-dependent xanthine dehydrogenase [Eubacterium sp. BIOML-A1]MSD08251.1 selenium-dependent xanthine dehydrogenase [Eubacterium sp. BIOML-A2]RYT12714.1 selenium-dependent xanthine dehydrogenase [Eubacterium sp. am_0171]CUO20972.1 Aldehyde oxidoreductase [[Eubacterium] contortum] [Faecalicatena contorta]